MPAGEIEEAVFGQARRLFGTPEVTLAEAGAALDRPDAVWDEL